MCGARERSPEDRGGPQLPSRLGWLVLVLKRWSVSWFPFLRGPSPLVGAGVVGMAGGVLGEKKVGG